MATGRFFRHLACRRASTRATGLRAGAPARATRRSAAGASRRHHFISRAVASKMRDRHSYLPGRAFTER